MPVKTRVVTNTGKNIAIAIPILGEKSIAILIAISFFPSLYYNIIAILFAILQYPLSPNEF